MHRLRPSQLPLRTKLTIWYTLSLGLILLLFTLFLYVQVRRSLITQVDGALSLAANQAVVGVEANDIGLIFSQDAQNPDVMRRLQDDFVIYLLDEDGRITDALTSDDELPQLPNLPQGFSIAPADGEAWRIYQQEIEIDGRQGAIQVAQEMESIFETLNSLLTQIILGLPLALLLAALGGYLFARRALDPIHDITQTAQAISATDLAQRIHHQGPADEVGQLALTFDTMLDRIEDAFQRERRFTGDAAHELRTPLAALKSRIEVTLAQPRQPEAYRETLQTMAQQVERLIHLSNDLLFMSRLEQTAVSLNKTPINLTDFLGAVLDQIRPLVEKKSITLSTHIPPQLQLEGDFDLLIRLLLNILGNAVKFTPQGGEIEVTAVSQQNRVQIRVTDSGPGIAPEHLPHIFDRFYRAAEDRTRNAADGGGSGLGLSIAQEIARAHGGHIGIDSTVGKGTAVTLTLPL